MYIENVKCCYQQKSKINIHSVNSEVLNLNMQLCMYINIYLPADVKKYVVILQCNNQQYLLNKDM